MAGEELPNSAISSWSGFVYQGKIALYHSLILMGSGEKDFELQLDSTDDFAIYKNNSLVSAHQVKAKVGNKRNVYLGALKKSGDIILDRKSGTLRYFHISVPLDDMSDYSTDNGEVVKFYEYGKEKYCSLDDIEKITKKAIKSIFDQLGIVQSEQTLNLNYCLVSEQISSKAIYIHAQNQLHGYTENEAAYKNRISSSEILETLLDNQLHQDVEYFAAELRGEFFAALEAKVDEDVSAFTEQNYLRTTEIFRHLYSLPKEEVEKLCQLLNPSERFSKIHKIDVFRYTRLIGRICVDPVLKGVPHYLSRRNSFYLPTALTLVDEIEASQCAGQINEAVTTNEGLLTLLFEYNNLIAAHLETPFKVESKITDCDDAAYSGVVGDEYEARITKQLRINVLPLKDAEAEINA
ncbi:ABC-three component system protein [Pseudomonas moraviensis]|nr:ABC-three component system protein [Pseudomonas moraviensis]